MSQYDELTGLELQVKRPSESIPYTFVFTSLASGESIQYVDSVVQANRGVVAGSADLTITSLTHDGDSKGQVWLAGGTDDEYYCVTMTITTTVGAVRTCSGVLFVNGACG